MSEKKTEFNPLSNKKIKVKYILNLKNGVSDPRHVTYGAKLDVAHDFLYCKIDPRTGLYVDPFTEDEREFVAKKLGMKPDDLSAAKQEKNFFDKRKVKLGKSDTILDLSQLGHWIDYKILLTNNNLVAESLEATKYKDTYLYYMTTEEDEKKSKNNKLNIKSHAYINYGKMQSDREIMVYMIWRLTGASPASTAKMDDIKAMLQPLIETKTGEFNQIYDDELINYKSMIYQAFRLGVITRRDGEYFMDGDALTTEGSASLTNAASFIASPINSEIKLKVEARIENAKE